MAKGNEKTILVTGATGKQGGATWRHLHAKGFSTRALVRNPDDPKVRSLIGRGAEVVRGDQKDPASLNNAMDGVDGVFSVQASVEGPETEVTMGINVAEAARKADVDTFVYTSVGSADRHTGIPHFESKARVEEHIRNTGLRYTILRPVYFMENLLTMRDSIENGTLALPLSPDTRLQMIAADDIGAFAALAFEKPRHWQGRAVDIAGDEVSMTQLAEMLGRVTGRNVAYNQLSWDEFAKSAPGRYLDMFHWFEDVGYSVDISALRQELPALQDLNRWMQAHWQPKVQTA